MARVFWPSAAGPGEAGAALVLADGGHFRVLAMTNDLSPLGGEALRGGRRRETSTARAGCSTYAASDASLGTADEPLSASPLVALWTKGTAAPRRATSASPPRRWLAERPSRRRRSRRSSTAARTRRTTARRPPARSALLTVYDKLDRLDEGIALGAELVKRFPQSKRAFLAEVSLMAAAHRSDEVRGAARGTDGARSERSPDRERAGQSAAARWGTSRAARRRSTTWPRPARCRRWSTTCAPGCASCAGSSTSRRWPPRSAPSNRASAATPPSCTRSPRPRPSSAARRTPTTRCSRRWTAAATTGTSAAPEWFVIGRIAECYGALDAAREAYAKVERPKEHSPLDTWNLADRRLQALGAAHGHYPPSPERGSPRQELTWTRWRTGESLGLVGLALVASSGGAGLGGGARGGSGASDRRHERWRGGRRRLAAIGTAGGGGGAERRGRDGGGGGGNAGAHGRRRRRRVRPLGDGLLGGLADDAVPAGARRLERHDPRRDRLRRAARAGARPLRPARTPRSIPATPSPTSARPGCPTSPPPRASAARTRSSRSAAPARAPASPPPPPGEPDTVRQRGGRRLRQVALRRRRPRLGGRHQPGDFQSLVLALRAAAPPGFLDHRAGRRRQQQRRHRRGDRRAVVGGRWRRRSDQRHDLHRLGGLPRLGGLVPRPAHGRRVRPSVRRRLVAGGLGGARHPQVEAGRRHRLLRASGQRAGDGRAAELRQRHRLRGRHDALVRQHPALLRRPRRRRLALGRHRHDHLAVVDDGVPPGVDRSVPGRPGAGDAVPHLRRRADGDGQGEPG